MSKTYVIGEIGQNHNGSVDIAKLLIDVASRSVVDELFGIQYQNMDAVKLTKRDLNAELSNSAMSRPYDSPHSFGKTYGEHRAALELSNEEHYELYLYAKSKGLDVVETLCAIGCLSILDYFVPDYLKVASRDLTNLPLLQAMSGTKIPMIISTGMAGEKELNEALDVITKHHENICILHCLSQYPSEYKNINLNTIKFLKERYSKYRIGYSDHSIGIAIPIAAVAMGAEIIEKHITIDREMKGTDQAGSLAIDGIHRMMRDIRNVESSFGQNKMHIDPSVKKSKVKLERSIAAIRKINKGEIIEESDLHLLSPGDGYKWYDRGRIIGKIAKEIIFSNEIIYSKYISG